MVYTQYQRFVATLILVSILSQSCGNPGWESEKPVIVDKSIFCSESSVGVARGVCENRRSTSPSSPVHGSMTHTTTPPHTPVRQSPHFLSTATAVRPLGDTHVSTQHAAKNLQYVVCDEDSLARHKPSQHATSRVVTPSVPLRNSAPIRSVASSVVMKSTSSPLLQSLPLKPATKAVASPGILIGPFALSSGQKVIFGRVSDHWQASVKNMWGTFFREITLPVICKGDLPVVLHNLQGKGAVHKQRCIHILETDQLPWAPRVVYVGAMGLRGGMEKESRQVQEQTDAVHVLGNIDRVAVSGLPLHETSDKEQDDAARQAERRRISSERRRQKILANAASRLASIKDVCPVDHDHKEYTQGGAKEQDAQGLPPNESITAWRPPCVASAAPTSVPFPLSQDYLPLRAQSVNEALLLTHTPAACELVIRTQLAKDVKLPSLSRITALSTPEEAQSAVEIYLERWSLETPSGRAVIWEQGQDILKNLEAIKKATKRSYRRQVLSFEINDIDPLVWNRVLQQQQATQAQLRTLRGLRTRLLNAFQLNGQELIAAGIQATIPVAVGEAEIYSSDEEVQQLSDQSRRNHAAFVVGIGKVLQGRIEELLALLDDAVGTTIAPYITLLSSTPELPDLLGDYTANFSHKTDDEGYQAELLGSLLAEVILQFVPLPKVKKVQLNKIRHKLGQAAQRVVFRHSNQLKNPSKKEDL